MAVKQMTAVGLIFGMIGVILLFFFGPPPALLLPDGSELVWSGRGGEEQVQKASRYTLNLWLSRIGLLFIFVGFALQLIAQYK